MTKIETRLQEIKNRANKATKGPWEVGVGNTLSFHHGKNSVVKIGERVIATRAVYSDYIKPESYDQQTYDDIEFIAHARTDISVLLDHIAKLEKVVYGARVVELHLLKKDSRWLEIEKLFTVKLKEAFSQLDGDSNE